MSKVKYITILASGTGSNAREILRYLKDRPDVKVGLIISNKPNAGVLDIAVEYHVPTVVMTKTELNDPDHLLPFLQEHNTDLIVLAGFLLLVPAYLTQAYPDKIVNIHPALLPKFGGKGMYGMHVHQAVKDAEETETGITIHYVNEHYDEGRAIFQASTVISPSDDATDIAKKVLELEHRHFPEVVYNLLKGTAK